MNEKRKVEIRQKYTRTKISFSKSVSSFGNPLLPVVLKSPKTSEETKFSQRFILDTGAQISIINSSYKSFLIYLDEIDTLRVRYGAGNIKKLPIFKVVFIIKGKEFNSTVAYDDELPYLLLGHYDFFEKFSYSVFDSTLKQFRLIKL